MKLPESEPNCAGPHGEAWIYDLEALNTKYNAKPHATLVSWCIHAPWAHPFWSCYAFHLIHLRPVEGLPDPKIYLPGATHEVFLFALSPDHDIDLGDYPKPLQPVNFSGQFIVPGDSADRMSDGTLVIDLRACSKVADCVRDIVNGELSPDTDFRQQWVERFSDSNLL